eukprot:COSAG01_NODE_2139_length_8323_cov_13.355788_4_plen_55_part_00
MLETTQANHPEYFLIRTGAVSEIPIRFSSILSSVLIMIDGVPGRRQTWACGEGS